MKLAEEREAHAAKLEEERKRKEDEERERISRARQWLSECGDGKMVVLAPNLEEKGGLQAGVVCSAQHDNNPWWGDYGYALLCEIVSGKQHRRIKKSDLVAADAEAVVVAVNTLIVI